MYKNIKMVLIIPCIINISYSQNIDISKFYYRDYLDFGQNKGAFTPGAKNITLLGKDGKTYSPFPDIPFPDFSAKTLHGSSTALSRNHAVTALHVTMMDPNALDVVNREDRTFGQTRYEVVKSQTPPNPSGPYSEDTKFVRFDRYVVEGGSELLETGITNHSSKKEDANKPERKKIEEENINKLKKVLQDLAKDSDNRPYEYQAGSGHLQFRGGEKVYDVNKDKMLIEHKGMRGGGVGVILSETYQNYTDMTKLNNYDSRGIALRSLKKTAVTNFDNRGTQGDSGSSNYVYNKKDNKWYLMGVLSVAGTHISQDLLYYSFVDKKEYEDYKKTFEKNINLNNNKHQLTNNNLVNTNTSSSDTLAQNKDIIFSGGGEIEVKSDINRMVSGQTGGFVFKGGNNSGDIKTYTIKPHNSRTDVGALSSYGFEGSGLDIEENAKVVWGLKNLSYTQKNEHNKDEQKLATLHKIGKGTLEIQTNNNSSSNLGYLRVGDGKVIFNTDKKAYDGVYITSGRATIELTKDKAEGIGASKITPKGRSGTVGGGSNYKLSQQKKSDMGIYFGNNGGNLDLKGNSLTVNMIASNDHKANIINTDNTNKSNFTFEGYKYKEDGNKDTNNKTDYIYHGSIGLNTSQSNTKARSAANNKSNIDLIQKESTKGNHNLVFDGFIDIAGKLDTSNSNITLQGHPTTHAMIRDETMLNKVKEFEGKALQERPYMDLSRPSTLDQPDWDDRNFKFGEGINLSQSTLNVGRNANLESNINANNNSTINFGGNNMKHFIDKFDGSNVTGNGLAFKQEVESKNLEANNQANDTITYKGKITGDKATINSSASTFEASLDLKNNSKLNAQYLTINSNSSLTLNNSNATINTLVLKNVNNFDNKINLTGNSKFEVKNAFGFDGSTFDLNNINNNTATNKPTLPTNYDVYAVNNSNVTGSSKDLIGNVFVGEQSQVTLKSLTLKDTNPTNRTKRSTENKSSMDGDSIKDTILVDGNPIGKNQTQDKAKAVSNPSKLTINGQLKAENLNNSDIILNNNGELSTAGFTSSNVKESNLDINNNSKFTSTGSMSYSDLDRLNLSLNNNSSINASNQAIKISGSNTSANTQVLTQNQDQSNIYSSNISLNNESKISAKSLSISNSSFNVTLDNKSNLTLNDNIDIKSSNANKRAKRDLESNSNSNSIMNLLNNATLNTKDLKLTNSNLTINVGNNNDNNASNANLNISGMVDVNNSNLTIKSNQEQSFNIKASGSSNIVIDNFKLNRNTNINASNSTMVFNKLSYDVSNNTRVARSAAPAAVASNIKEIKGNVKIQEELKLNNVGAKVNGGGGNKNGNDRFYALKLDSSNGTLTLENNSKLNVGLHADVKSDDNTINLGTYYTLLSAYSIIDNRSDKRTNFTFSDNTKTLFVTSKIENNKLKVKFTKDDPKSFNELSNHISDNAILGALLQHNPNDMVIDTAVKTDDYQLLDKYLNKVNETMHNLASNNNITVNNKVLITSSDIMSNRIGQVKNMRRASNDTPIYLANNSKLVSLRLIKQLNNKTFNNVWLNAGGGYFKSKDNDILFYGTNLGYDRTFDFKNSALLLGVMIGYGQSKLNSNYVNANSSYYNAGLYLDIDSGNNEFQSNINALYIANNKQANISLADRFNSYDNLNNNGISMLWSNYYKYRFEIGNAKQYKNYIKPILLADIQMDMLSGYKGDTYKQQSINNMGLDLGGGVEYLIIGDNSMYTISLLSKYNVYNSMDSVLISLSNANNFISYKLDKRPLSFQPSFSGYIHFQNNISLQYGVSALIDIKGGIGGKGDIKIEYRF